MTPPDLPTTIVGSFRCAIAGVLYVFRTQRNARIHAVMAIVVAATALAVGCSAVEFAVLALTSGLVIVTEIVNTAAETIVDLASPEFHDLAKTAKDTAAAGVLMAALTSVVVGLTILGPPLLDIVARI